MVCTKAVSPHVTLYGLDQYNVDLGGSASTFPESHRRAPNHPLRRKTFLERITEVCLEDSLRNSCGIARRISIRIWGTLPPQIVPPPPLPKNGKEGKVRYLTSSARAIATYRCAGLYVQTLIHMRAEMTVTV